MSFFFCNFAAQNYTSMLRRLALYIVLLFTNAVFAVVYTPASVPNPKDAGQANYVANPDAILADSDVVWLNKCAAMLEKQTRAEMCVVALGAIGETEAFDFAYELFQRWGIGKKGQNTGVLMLFVLDSHDIRIMTGTGIEGVLPDARCSQIIHDDMIPAFRAGDYGGGLCLGALRIFEVCTDGEAPEELRNAKSITNRGKYAEDEDEDIVVDIIVITAFILLIIFLIWITKKYGNDPRFGSGVGGPMGSGGFGGGRGFGGGFSGGSWGGGATSGGGAGGKW